MRTIKQVFEYELYEKLFEILLETDLPDPYKEFLAETLATRALDTIEKFIKGNKEHGGNLFARDLSAESYAETLDLAVYHDAANSPKLEYYKQAMDKWLAEHSDP